MNRFISMVLMVFALGCARHQNSQINVQGNWQISSSTQNGKSQPTDSRMPTQFQIGEKELTAFFRISDQVVERHYSYSIRGNKIVLVNEAGDEFVLGKILSATADELVIEIGEGRDTTTFTFKRQIKA